MPLRIVQLSDLHLEAHSNNLAAAAKLLEDERPDLTLVGGDNGGNDGIAATVAALKKIHPNTAVAWVKGNHDLWGHEYSAVWHEGPQLDATYLEIGNLELPCCTVVGSYGHYDYRAGLASISFDTYESFTNGRVVWNDRYIQRLGKSNPSIAAELLERFADRYQRAEARGLPIVVLTHTVPFGPTDDNIRSFVTAYLANVGLGDFLLAATQRPAVVFCGHTHRPMRFEVAGIPVINVGSDYRDVRIATFDLATE